MDEIYCIKNTLHFKPCRKNATILLHYKTTEDGHLIEHFRVLRINTIAYVQCLQVTENEEDSDNDPEGILNGVDTFYCFNITFIDGAELKMTLTDEQNSQDFKKLLFDMLYRKKLKNKK